MLFDLLLLPLLGGFVFIRLFRLTQYPTSRLSRQRLIIWATLAGVDGIVLSRTIVLLLLKIEPQAAVDEHERTRDYITVAEFNRLFTVPENPQLNPVNQPPNHAQNPPVPK